MLEGVYAGRFGRVEVIDVGRAGQFDGVVVDRFVFDNG